VAEALVVVDMGETTVIRVVFNASDEAEISV
jgi:hypothetical protein